VRQILNRYMRRRMASHRRRSMRRLRTSYRNRRQIALELLEPRILLSADPALGLAASLTELRAPLDVSPRPSTGQSVALPNNVRAAVTNAQLLGGAMDKVADETVVDHANPRAVTEPAHPDADTLKGLDQKFFIDLDGAQNVVYNGPVHIDGINV